MSQIHKIFKLCKGIRCFKHRQLRNKNYKKYSNILIEQLSRNLERYKVKCSNLLHECEGCEKRLTFAWEKLNL